MNLQHEVNFPLQCSIHPPLLNSRADSKRAFLSAILPGEASAVNGGGAGQRGVQP